MEPGSRPSACNLASSATVVLLSVAIMPAHAAECNVGFVCPLDYFCYKPTGICIQCLNCSSFNRVSSVSLQCHETSQECGECLPGYREEYLAQKLKRDMCVLSGVLPPSTTPTTTTTSTTTTTTTTPAPETTASTRAEASTNTTSTTRRVVSSASVIPREMITACAVISVISVVVFSIIGVRIFNYKRRKPNFGRAVRQDVEGSRTSHPEASSFPLLPLGVATVTVSEERTVVLRVPEQKQDSELLNAVPWRDPTYSRLCGSDSIEGDETPADDYHLPAINDEETTPSPWVPTTDQRPRHSREGESAAAPEADPSAAVDQEVPSVQPATSEDDRPEALGASSASLDRPFALFGRCGDLDEPARKRTRPDDAQSCGDTSRVPVPPPLPLDQNSCSSLCEDLTVLGSQPSRLPSASSDSNLRRGV
ncbi:mucin-5AC-like isoform X2 [Bacillus rossius redtenbacheri]|uniref:mucin-5AC-like isoform X2 n=1 Tax=Bacillus rossius redtenbacheri TaxID=93214 RepID=UPI002FDE0559